MTTPPSTAHTDVMGLVRAADPVHDAADPDAADSLLREILATPRPPRRGRTRPSRTVIVRIAAAGTAAAVVLGAVAAMAGDGRDGGATPASAAVINHALGALEQPPGSILHVSMSATQDNGDGTTVSWRDESWQQNGAPNARRQIETAADGTTTESGSTGSSDQVYDPATNTIYSDAYTSSPTQRGQHTYRFSPGPTAGSYDLRLLVYRVEPGHAPEIVPGRKVLVVTAAQRKALKDGSSVVKWVRAPRGQGVINHLKPVVVAAPADSAPASSCDVDPGSAGFGDQLRRLLQSCGARLVGHATVGGRDTLEIRAQGGHTTYYVDPDSYAPVELDTTGTTGGVDLRFTTWEILPGGGANGALLSLTAQHPSAAVDRNRADYRAAEQRLFPNG
jgi:hypothetical protein